MNIGFLCCIWQNRELVWRLTERDVLGRYRGSLLGLGWSFLNPMAMLAVYTFVFSQIFKVRWGTLENSGPAGFAINLFAGLIVFNLFAESVQKSPGLVLANPNYVKKVVFPLEVLSVVTVAGALFHAVIGLIPLFVVELFVFHRLPWTVFWLPLVWLPLLFTSLAMSWFLSALGVFIRDIGQLVALAVSILMFLSPIFFPISALPANLKPFLMLNLLAHIIEQTRRVLLLGVAPSSLYLTVGTAIGFVLCSGAFRLFRRAKKVFADVM
jgi:lipopolysaccharide transport system permease protein